MPLIENIKKILRPGHYMREEAQRVATQQHEQQLRDITEATIDTLKNQEHMAIAILQNQERHLIDFKNKMTNTLKNQEYMAIAILQSQERHLIDFKNEMAEQSDSLLYAPHDWLNHKLQLSQTLPVAVLNEKTSKNSKQNIDSVLLELPESWLQDEFIRPNRPTTDYFINISLVLAKMNLKTEQASRFGFSDTAPCLPADNQICLSFHTHGTEDRVWRIKESYIVPYYTFDRMGYSGFSELAQHPENFADAIAQFPQERAVQIVSDCKTTLIEKNQSKYAQPDILNTKLPKDYIFYPLQQAVDTVAIFSRILQADAIEYLAEQSAKHGVDLVLKRHPHCKHKKTQAAIEAVVKKYPNTHLINASVNELIPNARAVVGANSGVVFESLIHGKPVYSFASSDFQLATIAVQDKDDFAKVFATPEKQTDDVIRFLGWYLDEYCFRSDNIEQLENKVRACLESSSLSLPPNAATRTYIKTVFRALEAARRNTIRKPNAAALKT